MVKFKQSGNPYLLHPILLTLSGQRIDMQKNQFCAGIIIIVHCFCSSIIHQCIAGITSWPTLIGTKSHWMTPSDRPTTEETFLLCTSPTERVWKNQLGLGDPKSISSACFIQVCVHVCVRAVRRVCVKERVVVDRITLKCDTAVGSVWCRFCSLGMFLTCVPRISYNVCTVIVTLVGSSQTT